jgi:hypothetical protein
MWQDTSKPLAKAKKGENNENPAVRNGIQLTLTSIIIRNLYTPLEEYSSKGFSVSGVPAAVEAHNGVGELIILKIYRRRCHYDSRRRSDLIRGRAPRVNYQRDPLEM